MLRGRCAKCSSWVNLDEHQRPVGKCFFGDTHLVAMTHRIRRAKKLRDGR